MRLVFGVALSASLAVAGSSLAQDYSSGDVLTLRSETTFTANGARMGAVRTVETLDILSPTPSGWRARWRLTESAVEGDAFPAASALGAAATGLGLEIEIDHRGLPVRLDDPHALTDAALKAMGPTAPPSDGIRRGIDLTRTAAGDSLLAISALPNVALVSFHQGLPMGETTGKVAMQPPSAPFAIPVPARAWRDAAPTGGSIVRIEADVALDDVRPWLEATARRAAGDAGDSPAAQQSVRTLFMAAALAFVSPTVRSSEATLDADTALVETLTMTETTSLMGGAGAVMTTRTISVALDR